MERTYWHLPWLDDPNQPDSSEMDPGFETDRTRVLDPEKANLVSSWVGAPHNREDEFGRPEVSGAHPDYHLPVIDIDLPCRWVESSTPGHGHLYIEKPMEWTEYVELLRALVKAGIVQQGYADASISRGMTFVRTRKSKPTECECRPS